MIATRKETKRFSLTTTEFRSAPLRLEPRNHPGFTVEDLMKLLAHSGPRMQSLAALGLSRQKRADTGHKLIVPAIDFGKA